VIFDSGGTLPLRRVARDFELRCGGLFCGRGGLVEQGAGVGYEFGEAVGQGEDALGLAEADGVFGD